MPMPQSDASTDEQRDLPAEPAAKVWHTPVVQVFEANGAENLPGGFPDAGIDFS